MQICAVTKGRSISEVEEMLRKHPEIKIIAENRWPDCAEKFTHFKDLEKHFIGPLQSNKIAKVLPLVDVIQSVDSLELMDKINATATKLQKNIGFCLQINVSDDPKKHGIHPKEINQFIEYYLQKNFKNLTLLGLMTIGEQSDPRQRAQYFAKLKTLFDQINQKYFEQNPLQILSMGMSDDYEIALKEGATMVRLGRILYTLETKNRLGI